MSVEKPASLSLACNTQGAVTLARGETCPVTVTALDANGAALTSTQGIFVMSSDGNVVVFDALLNLNKLGMQVSGCQESALTGVDMFAKGAGDAIVTATVGGGDPSATLAVHVTP